jgi:hypothetical protein
MVVCIPEFLVHFHSACLSGSDAENEEIIYAEGEDENGPDDLAEETPFGPTGTKETEHSDDEEVYANACSHFPLSSASHTH